MLRAGVRTASGGAGTPAQNTAAGIAVAEENTAVVGANTVAAEANTAVVGANTAVAEVSIAVEASIAAGANSLAEIRKPKKI